MKRLLKNSIYVLVIAAILILISQVYGAKEPVLEYPDKIVGILPQEKLDNLLERWNEIGKSDSYKVGGQYKIEKGSSGEIVKIDLIITYWFDYSQKQGEYLNKVNTITGGIVIPTAKIFEPLHAMTVSMIFLPGKTPNITISTLNLNYEQIKNVKKMEIKDWSTKAYANTGTICIPPGKALSLP